MLKSIKLTNFQGHKDTKIDFGAGDTVIIGSTDSGKSSVFRAFEWVRTNRPLGTSFIHTGESTCKVELEIVTKDGIVLIERERGPGVNSYKVDGELSEAPGSGVPERLQELLNMGELNVQTQLDPHFMILDTPGKAAQTINAVTHLEEADRVIVALIALGKANNSEIATLEQRLNRANDKRSNPVFGLLGDFESTLGTAEELEKNQKEKQESHDGLRPLLAFAGSFESDVCECESSLSRYSNLDGLVSVASCITDKLSESIRIKDALLGAIGDCVNVENELVGVNAIVERFSGFAAAVEHVEEDVVGIGLLQKSYSDLTLLLTEIKGVDTLLGGVKKVKENLDGVWTELLADMDMCPVCETGLDDEHKQIAVENLK